MKRISLKGRWQPHDSVGESKGIHFDNIPGLHDANTPVTIALWVWFVDSGTSNQRIFYCDQLSGDTDDAGVRFYIATSAGEDIMFDCKASVTNPYYRLGETVETTLGDNVGWNHICARWNGIINGSDAPDIFINGVQHTGGTSTDGDGTRLDASGSHSFGGREVTQARGPNSRMAGAGRWKAYLSDAEIYQLAQGTHPLDVRPEQIVLCPDFTDFSNLAPRYPSKANFVETGAVVDAPPKLKLPKAAQPRFALADALPDTRLLKVPHMPTKRKRVAIFASTATSTALGATEHQRMVEEKGWYWDQFDDLDAENAQLAREYDLIIITEDVSSTDMGTKYATLDTPILLAEILLEDDHGHVGASRTDYTETTFTSHPIAIAAGLAGKTQNLYNAGTQVMPHYASFGCTYDTVSTNSGNIGVIACDPNRHVTNAGAKFTSRRVLWLQTSPVGTFTRESRSLIHAAMDWLIDDTSKDILVPIEEDLPDLATFEKPWTEQPL